MSIGEDNATSILRGYTHIDWPSIAADRSPSTSIHVASLRIPPTIICDAIPLFLAAIARTLGAYCGVTDILLAFPSHLHGHVIPVRVTWDKEKTWQDLLTGLNTVVQHSSIPVESIQNYFSLKRSDFPCLAVLDTFNRHFAMDTDSAPAAKFTCTMDGLLQVETPISRTHPTVADQILSQVLAFAEHAVLHPRAPVASHPPLQDNLLSVWERKDEKGVANAYPHIPSVSFAPDYLSRMAHANATRVAVRWYPDLENSQTIGFESITYAALEKQSNQMANWLVSRGLKYGDRVAVCLERNLHFHRALTGIMKAGGCYVPIDPELPLERKKYIAMDADAAFVLTTAQIAPIDVFGLKTVYVEEATCQHEIQREDSRPINRMKPDGLAYLLYTSGTTGNPKGCLLTHLGLAQALLALGNIAAEGSQSVTEGLYLAVASIAFDVHLAETFVPIALGIPLLCARRSQLLGDLPVYVKKFGVTHVGIVPSLIEATLNAAHDGVGSSDIVLRYIASGGEKMSDSILDRWADHPQVRLANFYGPSEVTIGCCARYMTSKTQRSNVGRAFENVSAYVVDEDMNIVCRGAVGELVVEGPLVGRGYHGQPDLTAKVFKEWPRAGCWSYRTGDLVRMMPDSTIEILGRIDTQIKLRGVRIESEGISAIVRNAALEFNGLSLDVTTVLAKHPEIRAEQLVSLFSMDRAATVATRKSVKPHIVKAPEGLINAIKAQCESELAVYMRPSHFIPLSWLPLSSNGKTDTKILLQLFDGLSMYSLMQLSVGDTDKASRPCTETELAVFTVLQGYIPASVDMPHPDLDIFECGLDSMAVIRFASALHDAFEIQVSAADIMISPKLAALALLFAPSHRDKRPTNALITTKKALLEIYASHGEAHIEDVLPPFAIQEGVLASSVNINTLYVQHVILSCSQGVNIAKLKLSWQHLVNKNQIFRTVFHFGQELRQVILRPHSCNLPWYQKESPDTKDASFTSFFLENEAREIAKDINANLSDAPPYRLSLYSALEPFLVLSIHHALFDGISLPVLIHEVEHDYLGGAPSTPLSCRDILSRVSEDTSSARDFWREEFEKFQWGPPILSSGPSAKHFLAKFCAPLSSMKELASENRVTLQALVSCAFGDLLARNIYKRKDAVFGVLRSGRLLPVPGADKALCPLVAVVPMRVDFADTSSLLQRLQKRISRSVEFESIPLSRVQAWIRPGQPLFEVLFSVSYKTEMSSSIWRVVHSQAPEPDYPLAVEVVLDVDDDTLSVQAIWTDDDRADDIQECLHNFEKATQALGRDPISWLSRPWVGIGNNAPSQNSVTTTPKVYETPLEWDALDGHTIECLTSIISDFLSIEPSVLTPSMSLISLGLDSIKSIGLAKVLTNGGFPVTSAAILRNSSLVSLATYLAQNSDLSAGMRTGSASGQDSLLDFDIGLDPENLKLSTEDVVEFFPATALQMGMLSQTINSKGRLYVHVFPLNLLPEVNIERLRMSWRRVVERLAILRTSFHFLPESGIWIQAVHRAVPFHWSSISLRTQEDYSHALLEFQKSICLDDEESFSQPPLWIRLFEIGDNDDRRSSYLALKLHHALYDGNSIPLLLNAVDSLYSELDFQPPRQFHEALPDFIQQEKHATPFWVDRLNSVSPARLPRCQSSIAKTFVLERELVLDTVKLKILLHRAAVTPQCLGQAAWAKIICKYTGSRDAVFGHTISGRSLPGFEDTIGPVLNTIPCCVRLKPEDTNLSLLKTIHLANLDAMPWQQASLRSIQKALKVENLWDSLFLCQPAAGPSDQPGRLWRYDTSVIHADTNVQYPLNVEMEYGSSTFTLKCACMSHYFSEDGLAALVDDLQVAIRNMIDHPDAFVLADLPDLTLQMNQRATSVTENVAFRQKSKLQDPTLPTLDVSSCRSILASVIDLPASAMASHTSLIALGIDSITAIQVASKLRKVGVRISASDIISSQTLSDLEAAIAQRQLPTQASPEARQQQLSVVKETQNIMQLFGTAGKYIEKVSNASSGMKWLIGAWQQSRGTRFQHAFAFELSQGVDISRLKWAWFTLVQRSEILRSTFASSKYSREPHIVTFKDTVAPWWTEEVVPEDTFYRSILSMMRRMVSESASTFKPPTRANLVTSQDHRFLVIHLHHFQYDAWSLRLLVHELTCIYRGIEAGVSHDLNAFLTSQILTSNQVALQEEYWRQTFSAGFIPKLWPPLKAPPISDVWSPARIASPGRFIKTDNAAILRASGCEFRARSLGLTLPSIFLAAWARIQAEFTSTSAPVFGLWQSGRIGSLADLQSLAVPCVNVLPIRVSLDEKSNIEVASSIQYDLQRRNSIVEHSDLLQVAEWIGLPNEPLSNVFVNIVKVPVSIAASTGESLLTPVNSPYYVPDRADEEERSTVGPLAITNLIKDDIMIDIGTLDSTDSIIFSIDASHDFVDEQRATDIIARWAQEVRQMLGL